MSLKGAPSPFERLREKYEAAERRCPECGHVDPDGGWRVTTSGSRVRYQSVCSACDAVQKRELHLE